MSVWNSKIDITAILQKKSNGQELTNEEIEWFIRKVYEKSIGDHQIGAFLMSVFIRGMTTRETAVLTNAMINNGSQLYWGEWIQSESERHCWRQLLVDKHSTGGVGDKVSLILAPILAACGAKIPMISGRGLGITGGTIDKLESIPGFFSELDGDQMAKMLRTVGCFIAGQSKDIAPTDKVLYAMRNETSTVASVPLITASIMSKKGVEDIRSLVLDVKFGSGAFMKSIEEAKILARSLVDCGNAMDIKTVALIDRMDSPLGNYVGNALEIVEVVKLLRGRQLTGDLIELTLKTAAIMLESVGLASGEADGYTKCVESLQNGSALEKFVDMLEGQGVNGDVTQEFRKTELDDLDLLKAMEHQAKHVVDFGGQDRKGFVSHIDALKIGKFCHGLGAGKTLPTDTIDYAVGVELLKKPGDSIDKGENWIRVFHNESEPTGFDVTLLQESIQIFSEPPVILPAIEAVLR